jgi:putative DNA primase/helicase
MMDEFEQQARGADGQAQEKNLLECMRGSILPENDLDFLEIQYPKKYLGPIGEGTIGEIFGPRGVGKTFFRDAIGLCLTRKMDLGPLKCENPAGVLIVDGEMGLSLLKDRRRLAKNCPAALRPLDFLSNEHLYRAGNPVINLADKKWRDAFLEMMKTDGRWDVIIFDNLSSFLPGLRENDQDAWAPINGFYLQLRWMGKAVVFVHHAGKSGDQRGTSGREDSLDYVLKLTTPPGHDPEEGCRFDATFTKSRSLTGPEAAPFTFSIENLHDGALTWTVSNMKEKKKETIIALLGNGVSQKDIAEIMRVDKAYVSRVRTGAVRDGILNQKGTEFTQSGYLKYGKVDVERYTG